MEIILTVGPIYKGQLTMTYKMYRNNKYRIEIMNVIGS